MARERIASNFNLHDMDPMKMARNSGFSRSRFYATFKKAFGTTPMEFLWDFRLQIATRKLDTDPSLAIGELARQCGFLNHTHFTRMFRKSFGMTPKHWRQRRMK